MNFFSCFSKFAFGRKCTRSSEPETIAFPLHTIEFIGPSGVGKSTFCKAYQEVSSVPWSPTGQIAGKQLTGEESELDGNIHWKILCKKVANLDGLSLNSFRKVKLINYLTQVIFQDLFLFYKADNSVFLLEEGICHNFSHEILELNDSDFLTLMKGRALIYVRTENHDLVAQRIQKRQKETGFIVPHHIGLNQEGLARIAEDSMHRFEKLTNRLQKIGVPFCTLDAEYSLAQAQEVCIQFERSIKIAI